MHLFQVMLHFDANRGGRGGEGGCSGRRRRRRRRKTWRRRGEMKVKGGRDKRSKSYERRQGE